MEALQIYKKLSQPPKTALKEIQAGDLKGRTDINPQWRYEAMTEQFGLVGIGWKYEVQKLWTEPGANGETLAFAQVAVFVRDPDTKEWSDAIVGIGGSKLINKFSAGPKSNDEGYKMAVTDAFSTSLKMIGVAADIYAGRWDGSKYLSESEINQKNGQKQNAQQKPQGQNQQKQSAPAGGWDTKEQQVKIRELLNSRYPDGTQIFSGEDHRTITAMRATKTADEVIRLLEEEVAKANSEYAQKQSAPAEVPEAVF